jgi:DNA-binding PadR family transcriptional regulator
VDDHPPPRRPDRPVQITERDRLLLAFAAEHRFVLCSQVRSLLGVSSAAAYARLRALRTAGYLRSERKLHGEPAGYQITRDGLRPIGSDLSPPRAIDLATYRHDAGLAWLMLAAHGGRFGRLREAISERRMRSHDARADRSAAPFGIRLGGVGPGGRERLHYPDLMVVTESGHRVAFELELSSKSPTRREGILAAYAADPRIDAVVYLVDRKSVGRGISQSAARVEVSGRVHVQNVNWGADEGRVRDQAAVQRIRSPGDRSRTGNGGRTASRAP